MKTLIRSARALTPWLSLAEPIVWLGILFVMKALWPSLFCVAINSGGKELICGSDYSHPGINLLQSLGLCLWVLLLVIGGVEVFRRRASWPAVIAWSVSALLLVGLAVLWLSLPVVDCP